MWSSHLQSWLRLWQQSFITNNIKTFLQSKNIAQVKCIKPVFDEFSQCIITRMTGTGDP
jgi:hypothetical protein